jgi:hypothetical protein
VTVDIWEAMAACQKLVMKASSYPDAQHRHFARFQGEPITILEIGIWHGGSLELWRRYFGEAATVVGLDIDPRCKKHEADGIHVEIGDQVDSEFLDAVADRWGPFDIVIDDGGHMMDQQIVTFETLFPRIKAGGVYVCEDTFTSYLSRYTSGHRETFMDFTKAKIDEMHAWVNDVRPPEPTAFSRSARSMHYYPGMVVIEKDDVEAPTVVGAAGHGLATAPMSALLPELIEQEPTGTADSANEGDG